MKGDFSRDTFDSDKHFSRVLMQQGRVLLDSDWNEQTSLLLYYMRTLATDIIGPHGGSAGTCGFQIITRNNPHSPPPMFTPAPGEREVEARILTGNFEIGYGRYYVAGLLCENMRTVRYRQVWPATDGQPDLQPDPLENGKRYLVYLDVWERHVSALEDESFREVALGAQGPDTASRARIVYQVKTLELTNDSFDFDGVNACESIIASAAWNEQVERWHGNGALRAKAAEAEDPDAFDPCITSPDARYRGAENQLYRVEIHRGGKPYTPNMTEPPATFKWSRENGSVVLPISTVSGKQVTLERMGRDARSGVQVGDWVEVFDEESVRRERPAPLLQVTHVDPVEMVVTLGGEPYPATDTAQGGRTQPADGDGRVSSLKNPLLRRWDQRAGDARKGGLKLEEGAALVVAGENDENWLELEDGIRIQFPLRPNQLYRAGDYWLIPARTATGDVEWPGEVGDPLPVSPHGIRHQYAPLARIAVSEVNGEVTVLADYRRRFKTLPADCFAINIDEGVVDNRGV